MRPIDGKGQLVVQNSPQKQRELDQDYNGIFVAELNADGGQLELSLDSGNSEVENQQQAVVIHSQANMTPMGFGSQRNQEEAASEAAGHRRNSWSQQQFGGAKRDHAQEEISSKNSVT